MTGCTSVVCTSENIALAGVFAFGAGCTVFAAISAFRAYMRRRKTREIFAKALEAHNRRMRERAQARHEADEEWPSKGWGK